jgi:hypothetical protein
LVGFVFDVLSSEDVKGSLVFFLFGLGLDFFEDFLVFVFWLLLLVVFIVGVHLFVKKMSVVFIIYRIYDFCCFSIKNFN